MTKKKDKNRFFIADSGEIHLDKSPMNLLRIYSL
jgi:hypothetical protein